MRIEAEHRKGSAFLEDERMRHHVLREKIYGISAKGRYLPALLLVGVMTLAGAGTATAASVAASGVDVSAYQMSLPLSLIHI